MATSWPRPRELGRLGHMYIVQTALGAEVREDDHSSVRKFAGPGAYFRALKLVDSSLVPLGLIDPDLRALTEDEAAAIGGWLDNHAEITRGEDHFLVWTLIGYLSEDYPGFCWDMSVYDPAEDYQGGTGSWITNPPSRASILAWVRKTRGR
jgi:hypothetical protein